jgi:FixJ family two-component response regulator
MKKRNVASRVEIIAIHKRLEVTVTKLDGGLCTYADGVNDQTIAEELKVSPASVQRLRTEMFGKLKPASAAPDTRVDELVTLADNLVISHSVLKDRINKLVALLALNRVVDCKHLEIK